MSEHKRSLDGLAALTPQCPSLEDWGRYSEGLVDAAQASRLLAHAADCAACGGLLADLTAEDQPLPKLRSDTPAFRRKLLQQFAPRPIFRRWLVMAAAAAAFVGVLVLSPAPTLWLLNHGENRTVVYRFTAMPYKPVMTRRGAASPDSVFVQLARFLATVHDQVVTADPWLEVRGRLALTLGGLTNQDAAIDALAAAHAAAPDNGRVSNDLAVALLVRSHTSENASQAAAQDVARAIALLTEAQQRGADPLFDFNLALAYEDQQTYSQALQAWEHFLALEPDGSWAAEAKEHIATLQQRQKDRGANRSRRSEDAVLPLAAQGFSAALVPGTTADDLYQQHSDPWLRELLQDAGRPGGTHRLALLSAMAQALSSGNASLGVARASEAREAFRQAGNAAGEEFATYELAYAFQRLSQPTACLDTLAGHLARTGALRYSWLQVQMGLTSGVCLAIAKKFGTGYDAVQAADAIARAARYESLHLRALGMASSFLREVGSYGQALVFDRQTIQQYWAGNGTRGTAYQAYYGLATALAGLGYGAAAAAAMQEAVTIAATLTDRPQEAMVRARYADLLIDLGRLSDAAAELQQSAALFDRIPSGSSAPFYAAYARLSQARLEARTGAFAQGLQTLARLEDQLDSVQNSAIEAQLWTVKADLLARTGDLTASEDALRRLLALGDASRQALPARADAASLRRQVSAAVDGLADRYVAQGQSAQAWQLWTRYNTAFRTARPDATKIIYAQLPSGPMALLARATEVHAVPLKARSVTPLIDALRRLLSDPNSSITRIQDLGRQAYDILIAPLQPYLGMHEPLAIAADATFSSIPFALLRTPKGTWLGDEHPLTYIVPVGNNVSDEEPTLSADLQLLAVTYGEAREILGTSLPALPDLKPEGEAAAAVFPKHVFLSGSEATLTTVIHNLASAQVVQFSGHAVQVADDGALVLAPDDASDGLLWASTMPVDVLRHIRLAVLAACSTSRSPDATYYAGAEIGRAFLAAGVPQVVAATWDVDSSATTQLIREFYAGLRAGQLPDVALAAASRVIRLQPRFAHPYYWAAFALYGR